MPIDKPFADHFAHDWINAWNSHDLEQILSLYSDGFTMSSPLIVKLAYEPSGKLHGKPAVGAYWATALQQLPDLHFELVDVLVGVDSVILYYRGHRGLSAEVFFFGTDGKVERAAAHYS